MQDNISKLYTTLTDNGYEDLGSEDKFRNFVKDSTNVKKLYAKLQEDGFEDLGSEDKFMSFVMPSQPSKPQGMIAAATQKPEPPASIARPTTNVPTQKFTVKEQNKENAAKFRVQQENTPFMQRQRAARQQAESMNKPAFPGIEAPQLSRSVADDREKYKGMVTQAIRGAVKDKSETALGDAMKSTAEELARQGYDLEALHQSGLLNEGIENVLAPSAEAAVTKGNKIIDKVFDDAQKKALNARAEATRYSGMGGTGMMGAGLVMGEKAYNKEIDPDKLQAQLIESIDKDALRETFNEVYRQAVRYGIDPKDYFNSYVAPRLKQNAARALDKFMTDQYMPENDAEYVLSGFSDSITGMLSDWLTKSASQNAYKQMALSKYDASTGTKIARQAVGLIASAPEFAVSGGVSSAVVKKLCGSALTNIMARGYTQAQAQRILASELARRFGTRVGMRIMQSSLSGSVNFATLEGMSEGARQLRDDDFDAGKILDKTIEGAGKGAIFGAVGGSYAGATEELHGATKVVSNLLGVPVNGAALTISSNAVNELNMMMGEPDELATEMDSDGNMHRKSLLHQWADNTMLDLMMRGTSHHNLNVITKQGRTDIGNRLRSFISPLSESQKILGANWQSKGISDEGRARLQEITGADNMLDALSYGAPKAVDMEKIVAPYQAGGVKPRSRSVDDLMREEQRQVRQQNWDRIMNDRELSAVDKQKLCQIMGAKYHANPTVSAELVNGVYELRDAKGLLNEKREDLTQEERNSIRSQRIVSKAMALDNAGKQSVVATAYRYAERPDAEGRVPTDEQKEERVKDFLQRFMKGELTAEEIVSVEQDLDNTTLMYQGADKIKVTSHRDGTASVEYTKNGVPVRTDHYNTQQEANNAAARDRYQQQLNSIGDWENDVEITLADGQKATLQEVYEIGNNLPEGALRQAVEGYQGKSMEEVRDELMAEGAESVSLTVSPDGVVRTTEQDRLVNDYYGWAKKQVDGIGAETEAKTEPEAQPQTEGLYQMGEGGAPDSTTPVYKTPEMPRSGNGLTTEAQRNESGITTGQAAPRSKSYETGRQAAETDDLSALTRVHDQYEIAVKRVEEVVPADNPARNAVDALLKGGRHEEAHALVDNTEMPKQQADALHLLIDADDTIDGVNDAIQAKTDAAMQQIEDGVKAISDEQGNVTFLTLRSGKMVHVVKGDINSPEGTIMVREIDPKTNTPIGDYEQITIYDIKSVGNTWKASDMIAADRERVQGELDAHYRRAMTQEIVEGNRILIKNGRGMEEVTVLSENADGSVTLQDADGDTDTFSREQVEQMAADAKQASYAAWVEAEKQAMQEAEQPQAETPQAQEPVATAQKPQERIVVDNEGNVDTVASSPDDVAEAIANSGENGKKAVSKELANARDAIRKIEEKMKKETAIDGFASLMKANENAGKYQAELDALRQREAFWKDQQQRIRDREDAERKAAEQARIELENKMKAQAQAMGTDEPVAHNQRAVTKGGLVIDEQSVGIDSGTATTLDAIGKALGVEIRIDPSIDTNGEWAARRGRNGLNLVRINPNTREGLSFVYGHEITHEIKNATKGNAELWQGFIQAVRKAIGEEAFDAKVKDALKIWNEHILKKNAEEHTNLSLLTEADAMEEVCCDFVGERIISDRDFANRLLEEVEKSGESSASIAQRIRNFIDKVLKAMREIVNPTDAQARQIEALENAKKMWGDLYEFAAAKEREKRTAMAEAERQRKEEELHRKQEARKRAIEKYDKPINDARKRMGDDPDALAVMEDGNREPKTLKEAVAQMIPAHSLVLKNWTDANGVQHLGLEGETGFKHSDLSRLSTFIGTRENGAVDIATLAERIYENLPEDMRQQAPDADRDIRNVIIELFSEAEKADDILLYVDNARIREAEAVYQRNKDREAYEAEREAYGQKTEATDGAPEYDASQDPFAGMDTEDKFSIRKKPEPKKKGIGYKVFYRGKDGKLYPPMVANPNGADTPVGVWIDAEAAPIANQTKTGRNQVRQGGKGTQGGSGYLSYRPGWHLGEIPYALQFNRKDANGNRTLFPKDFVWAEVEYAADKDYQEEATQAGMSENGKYRHAYAGLQRLPEDGFYKYRTNPNPETDPWIITGAMKVNRVLSREEVDDLVRKAGREPQKVEGDENAKLDVKFSVRKKMDELSKASNTIKKWLGSGARGKVFTIDLPKATLDMIRKETGRDFDSHNITSNGIVHGLKNHGVNGKKLTENSIPIRPEDAELIPYIMVAPSYIKGGSTDITNRESVRFYKNISNGYVVVVEKEYKNSPNDMETINIWAEKSSSAATNARRNAPDTNVQNAILSTEDIAKIRKDAEIAITNDVISAIKSGNSEKVPSGDNKFSIAPKKNADGDTEFSYEGDPKFSIRVFHGSAADFEKFDHKFMGTGEGNQSFGWGTYVTEVEDVGRLYAEAGAGDASYKGKNVYKDPYSDNPADRALFYVDQEGGTDKTIKFLKELIKEEEDADTKLEYQECIDVLKDKKSWDKPVRHIYQVDIPDDNGRNYLDWKGVMPNKEVLDICSKMEEYVKSNRINTYGFYLEDMKRDAEVGRFITGATLYENLRDWLPNDRAASDALSEMGYTGIKYPVNAMSGGNSEGTHNYVIFNENDAQIVNNTKFSFPKKKEDKTLMGVHNISEDKLKKALKLGGLANPSLAVIDTEKQSHTGFGNISLIPKSSLIDAKTGRNAGTYLGDAWTPTYPNVTKSVSKQGEAHIKAIAQEAAGGDETLANRFERAIHDYVEGNSGNLAFLFLKQKGLNPEVKYPRTSHSHEEYEQIEKIFGKGTALMPSRPTDEQNKALFDMMVAQKKAELEKRVEEISDEAERKAWVNDLLDDYKKDIADENGKVYFAIGDRFVNSIFRDEQRRNRGEIDWYGTDLDANNRVAKEGLSEEYNKWKENLLGDEDINEELFAGWTKDGYRRYVPNTVENASRLMNKETQTNSNNEGGIGATKSALLKKVSTLAAIRKNKGKLQDAETVSAKMQEASDELLDMIHYLADRQKVDDNRFINSDIAERRLQEALAERDPIKYLNKEYGYHLDADGEYAQQIKDFIKMVGELPAKYFETKFRRPVGLDEFAVAVVPETTSKEVIDGLKAAGLDVRTYDGTEENRKDVTMNAVNGRKDIKFSIAIERSDPFYSNAAKATEDIRQEKATGDQWLAMIKKNGGLKAEEDKWMGLSDWLKGKKSVTKAELQKFIADNAVEIEDVEYAEVNDLDNNPKMQQFQKEYGEALDKYRKEEEAIDKEMEAFDNEMFEKYGEGWANDLKKLSEEDRKRNRELTSRYDMLKDNDIEQLAFGDMIEEYGDDFGQAFEIDYGVNKIVPVMDMYGDDLSDAAKHFLEFEQEPINSTRLDYTTEGLENKREIALTVPAIEPYNAHDEIHFGDAGGGRAVAWIRFGDATGYNHIERSSQEIEAAKEEVRKRIPDAQDWSKWGKENGYRDILYSPNEGKPDRTYIVDKSEKAKQRGIENGFGLFVDEKLAGAYKTLEDAVEAYKNYVADKEVKDVEDVPQKVLVIDEIQSKRHQDGREKGYKKAIPANASEKVAYETARKEYDNYSSELRSKYGRDDISYGLTEAERTKSRELFEKLTRARIDYNHYLQQNKLGAFSESNVPDAPFQKTWHELAMKRMLRYAAENDYDKIAWTTGEQQAERYGLSKVLDSVTKDSYDTTDEHTLFRLDFKNESQEYITVDNQTGEIIEGLGEGKPLSELVGKEMADKMMELPMDKSSKIGQFAIGGEGMKGFYDRMLPQFIDKYGKKWGVKTGEVELDLPNEADRVMHSVDVTPEMKESVMKGQPKFSMSRTPEEFKEQQKQAVEQKGIVMPRLNEKEIRIVDVPKHGFEGTGKEVLKSAEKWAKENIVGTHTAKDSEDKTFEYTIAKKSIDKYLSASSLKNSDNIGVHISVLKKLPEVISNSIEAEIHPDYTKNDKGVREADSPINNQSLIHRFYGAATIDGKTYRVKTTMKEYADKNRANNAYTYEVTKIELLEAPVRGGNETSKDPVAMTSNNSISGANLLKDIVKSYEKDKKLIAQDADSDNLQSGDSKSAIYTDNFKKWFGDWENDPENASKVVDENGEPKVVLHGTPNRDFYEFKDEKIGSTNDSGWLGRGFYFYGNNPEYARQYSKGGRVMEVYLDIRNPYYATYEDMNRLAEANSAEASREFREQLEAEGYDGVFYNDDLNEEWVAFRPEQIKSATENNGNFDATNPDIRFSMPTIQKGDTFEDVVRKGQEIKKFAIINRMRQRKGESAEDFIQRQQDYLNLAVKSPQEARNRVVDEIKERLDSKSVDEMGKKALNQLLQAVRDAKEENLPNLIKRVNRTINELQDKALTRQMKKLLDTKTVKRNQRNMSVAGRTDDAVAQAFDFMKGKLVDVDITEHDSEKKRINASIAECNARIRDLERQLSEATDPAEHDRIAAEIADQKDLKDELREELDGVQKEIDKARSENVTVTTQSVNDMIADLDEKFAKSTIGEGEWTSYDAARLTACHILNKRLKLNDLMAESKNLQTEIAQLEAMRTEANKAHNRQQAKMIDREIVAHTDMRDDILQQIVATKQEINNDLAGMVEGGKTSLMAKKEQEQVRKRSLILGFYNDIASGKFEQPSQEKAKKDAAFEGGVISNIREGLRNTVGSFEYLMQHMPKNTLGKDSWMYRYFMLSKDGVMAAQENYMKGIFETQRTMNDKLKELWGEKNYEDAIKQNEKHEQNHGVTILVDSDGMEVRKNAGVEINTDGGLSKAQATYLYMVWKMPDGRAKLEKMGFDEQSIAEAVEFIGEKNKAWADWVQEEFLPTLREKYNERYVEMYYTSLGKVANYVPLKINQEARHQDVDVDEMMGRQTLNQKTGSLINRTHNLIPVDLTRGAYEIISEHVQNMEEWYHMARVRQDLNYILSSTAIRGAMNANERASHSRLVKAAQIATGCYKTDQGSGSKIVSGLTSGLAAANIALRNTTALKQTLSLPAFLGYSQDPRYIVQLLKNSGIEYAHMLPTFAVTAATMGYAGRRAMMNAAGSEKNELSTRLALSNTMRWCIENMPSFRQRVAKGSVGNVLIDEFLSGDKNAWERFKAKLGEYGMAANGLVDATTCAIGIKSIYDYKYGQLKKQADKDLKDGLITQEEYEARLAEADRLARCEADIYYNGTQQSTHPAFLAPIQMDRDLASKMFTLYKNSPLSYARKALLNAQTLYKLRNWKTLQEEYARQYMEADNELSLEKAMSMANNKLTKELGAAAFNTVLYGYFINWLWNCGGKGLLGWLQGEEDEEEEANKTVPVKVAEAICPVLNGVPMVDLVVNTMAGQDVEPLLLYDVQQRLAKAMKGKEGEVSEGLLFDVVNNIAFRSGLGIDLNTVGNIYLGAEHLVRNGIGEDNRTKMIALMYLLNTPNSNRKQVARTIYSEFDDPEEFVEAVMLADKAVREGTESYKRFMPGFKEYDQKKVDEIIKEWLKLRATPEQKEAMKQKKANTLKELETKYTDREALQRDYDNETDPTIKKRMGDLLKKMQKGGSGQGIPVGDRANQLYDQLFVEKPVKDSEYLRLSTSEDVKADYNLSKQIKHYKAFWDELKKITDEDEAMKYEQQHEKEIERYATLSKIQGRINSLKGKLKKVTDAKEQQEIMQAIRDLRSGKDTDTETEEEIVTE